MFGEDDDKQKKRVRDSNDFGMSSDEEKEIQRLKQVRKEKELAEALRIQEEEEKKKREERARKEREAAEAKAREEELKKIQEAANLLHLQHTVSPLKKDLEEAPVAANNSVGPGQEAQKETS